MSYDKDAFYATGRSKAASLGTTPAAPASVPKKKDTRPGWEKAVAPVEYIGQKLHHGITASADIPEALIDLGIGAKRLATHPIDFFTGEPNPNVGKWNAAGKLRGHLKNVTGMDTARPWQEYDIENPALNVAVNEGMPILGKSAEYVGNSLGLGAPLQAGLGAVTGTLEALNVPEGVSDLVTLLGWGGKNAILSKSRRARESIARRGLKNIVDNPAREEKIVQDIGKNLALPYPENFHPTTAMVAQDPNIAATHRSLAQVTKGGGALSNTLQENLLALNEAVKGLAPKAGTLVDTQKSLEPWMEAEKAKLEGAPAELEKHLDTAVKENLPYDARSTLNAGRTARTGIQGRVDTIRADAREATGADYDILKTTETRGPRTNFDQVLADTFRYEKGKNRAVGNKARQLATPNQNEYLSTPRLTEDLLESIGNEYPQLQDQLMTLLTSSTHERLPQTFGELFNVRKALNDSMRSARRAGDKERQGLFGRLIPALDADLANIDPAAYEHMVETNKTYKGYMDQLDTIEDNPLFKKMLAQSKKGQYYLKNDSAIPAMIVEGKLGLENAENYLAHFPEGANDPNLRQHIHKVVSDKIVGDDGRVKLKDLERFKADNAGLFRIYPELETRLANVQNANAWVANQTKAYKKYESQLSKSIASDLLNENVDGVVRQIIKSKNPSQDLKLLKSQLMELSPDGLAWGGVQQVFADHITKIVSKTGQNDMAKSYEAWKKEMHSMRKFLPEVFDENQLELVEQITNAMKAMNAANTHGTGVGSPTQAWLRNAINANPQNWLTTFLASDFGKLASTATIMSHPQVGVPVKVMSWFARMHINSAQRLINEALVDPNMAQFLLTDRTNKKVSEKAFEALKTANKYKFPLLNFYDSIKEGDEEDKKP